MKPGVPKLNWIESLSKMSIPVLTDRSEDRPQYERPIAPLQPGDLIVDGPDHGKQGLRRIWLILSIDCEAQTIRTFLIGRVRDHAFFQTADEGKASEAIPEMLRRGRLVRIPRENLDAGCL